MSQSDDIQSKLAKVMAGALQVESPKAVFARYRERLERLMPSIVRERDRVPEPAIVDLAPPVPPLAPPVVRALPQPGPGPQPVPAPVLRPATPPGPTRSGVVRRRSAASAPNLESLFALLDSSAPDIAAKLRADLAAANKGTP